MVTFILHTKIKSSQNKLIKQFILFKVSLFTLTNKNDKVNYRTLSFNYILLEFKFQLRLGANF